MSSSVVRHRYFKPAIITTAVVGALGIAVAIILVTRSSTTTTSAPPPNATDGALLPTQLRPYGKATSTEILLDIPWREQPFDPTDLGYCGETALSMAGQYFGMWIAPEVVRTMSDVDQLTVVLPQDDSHGKKLVRQMQDLRLTYSLWDYTRYAEPQVQPYLLWVKRALTQFQPVLVVSYVCDTDSPNADYDHIMPAVGIASARLSDMATYRGDDRLSIHSMLLGLEYAPPTTTCVASNASAVVTRSFDLWQGNLTTESQTHGQQRPGNRDSTGRRDATRMAFSTGGSIPISRDFGMAVTGIADPNRVAFPTRLVLDPAVPTDDDDDDVIIHATLKLWVNLATHGRSYSIVRYNDPSDCPAAATKADDYLRATFEHACTITASADAMAYADPTPLNYDDIYIYRVVANQDVVDKTRIPREACNGTLGVLPPSNFCGTVDSTSCPFRK
ncbi:Aste57867_15515 [Aphanomyces stellatus]|uniref:Aste57867_15515 protein n=1 Tax=Aphanomyces stellatus TaxID=120398 RepID=A0A485L688_9STRA|nr:hypothetical protein As57867_015459 [Aphanomyces stellatus]VFT92317.1 Aste57867_15515 [Aphanomyces stellatus]